MKKILLIEDDELFIKLLHTGLKDEEFFIFEARNGEEGLEMAFKEHPDLILLDIMLPKMDGMNVLKNIREDEWGKDAKILILTNIEKNEKVSESVKLGIDGYLFKPDWKIENIAEKIHEELEKPPRNV